MDVFIDADLRSALAPAAPFGSTLFYAPEIASTMDLAREQAEAGAPHGTLILTDYQTAGRGRQGRHWEAPRGTSLLMTWLLRPDLPVEESYRAVMLCGLAACEAVEALTGLNVQIKWPNDLQVRGRKLAGLLPDSAIMGERTEYVLIGMGLNVNQRFPSDDLLAMTATSLAMELGRDFNRLSLLTSLARRLAAWDGRIGGRELFESWRARSSTLGTHIRAHVGDQTVEGEAFEMHPSGALLLRDEAGQVHRLTLADATLNI